MSITWGGPVNTGAPVKERQELLASYIRLRTGIGQGVIEWPGSDQMIELHTRIRMLVNSLRPPKRGQ